MDNNKIGLNSAEELSLKELILKLKNLITYFVSKWKFILCAGILGGLLGVTYSYIKKPIYTATYSFVLDQGKSKGLSQYAGLAMLAGLDLGSGSGLFQTDNIADLYESRVMLQKSLLSYGVFDGKKTLIIDRYIKFNKLRDKWVNKPELKNISFNKPPENFSRLNDSIMTTIVDNIKKTYLQVDNEDVKSSIIKVSVKSGDEQFSKCFVEAVVDNVNKFYVETKTKKSINNLAVLQHQADSVKNVLNRSLGAIASSIDANPNANSALQILRVPSQRKQVDVQASSAIYAEVVKNLELAKISMRQETPLIQVLDAPIYPLQKEGLGKIKGLILGSIVLSMMAIIYLWVKKLLAEA